MPARPAESVDAMVTLLQDSLDIRGGQQMPAPQKEVITDVLEEERLDNPWRVILFNDNIHSFDEVIYQLTKATGCSAKDAEKIAWTVHLEGKASAFEGSFEECFRVQGVLREIQLVTEIEG
jgi:ATP-dependent Clp protease adapter protein ClpS